MTQVLYLPVSLKVLPDSHGLLDQVVQVLGEVRGQTLGLKDPQDLVSCDKANLSHTVRVPQDHTCSRQTIRGFTLSVVLSFLCRQL